MRSIIHLGNCLMNKHLLLAASLLATGTTCSASDDIGPSPLEAPNGALMAAWTQITGNASQPGELAGLVRFAVAGNGGQSACNQFEISTNTSSIPAMTARKNVATSEFPVTVCEAIANPAWTTISITSNGKAAYLWAPDGNTPTLKATLPTLHAVGRHPRGTLQMLSVGDTGCRDNSDQSCASTDTWPFEFLSAAAAAEEPDFVMHVGDYRYSNKGTNDTWEYWYQEFFYPARELLLAAPWAMVRGNHETCGYHSTENLPAPWGTGWFYFLQHNDAANSVHCHTGGTAPYQEPWLFDVGIHGAQGTFSGSHRIIVMDSSTDTPATQQTDNFVSMIKASTASTSSWWTGHRPIWGINPYSPVSTLETDLDQSLTTALKASGSNQNCWADTGLPCSLKAVISGHIHNLERVQFFGNGSQASVWQRPMQYVSGNSGVVLTPTMNTSPCSFTVPGTAPQIYGPNLSAMVDWENKFGFTLWTRDTSGTEQSGWQETRYFYENGTMSTSAPPKLDGDTPAPTCS